MTRPQDKSGPTRVVFLGGCGEIGRNMLAVESGGRILVIDAGLSFPNDEMLGIDLVLPDFSWLTDRAEDIVGILLTHGHEDHVGALPWVLRELDVPVYGTPLTLGIAQRRLADLEVEGDLREVAAPGRLSIDPFECEFLAVSHSIPDAISVAVTTTNGRVLYTSDFKIDSAPIDGRFTDLDGFARVASAGIDLMLSDSTNAETPGRTPSEAVVGETLRDIFGAATGRIVVACFASNLHRVQQVCEAAEQHRRRVAFIGRSMVANVEVGIDLGYLRVSDETVVPIEELESVPRERVVVICTGSQGEPLSALSLIAAGEHRFFRVERGDTVILSASAIPGNEPAVHRVINGLFKEGATVHYAETSPVHVSGHAAADELRQLLEVVRPRHFVPVHGEYRQLAAHVRIAERAGVASTAISIVEDGDVLELQDGRVTRGERVRAGTVLVDGLGVGDVGPVVLRDRRHLADDGIIVCVLTIDPRSGEVLAGPDLVSRGFVYVNESRDFLDEAADVAAAALDKLEPDAMTDWVAVKKTCRRSLGEFVWQQTGRRPMVLPVIMEV